MELVNRTGWRRSPPSDKDWDHRISSLDLAPPNLPPAASLEQYVYRIDDQFIEPWCVCYGACNAIEFQMQKAGLPVPQGGFSKAWLYARCKELDGIPGEDGTFVKTALWIALNEGLCPDFLCPTENYNGKGKLPQLTAEMAREASKYKIAGFSKLQNMAGDASLYQVKQALAGGAFPIIATVVDNEWMDADPYLLLIQGTELGGHCTYLCRYGDAQVIQDYTGFVRDVNSWGETWAQGGMADMSYEYAQAHFPDGTPTLQEAWAFSVKPVQLGICERVRRFFAWAKP